MFNQASHTFSKPTFRGRSGYSFTFNGKEKDKEGMGGGGSTYDYGFRIYNAQLGKFLSVDPLTKSYPWYTPYQFAGNMPISAIDLDGLEELIIIRWYDHGKYSGETAFRIKNAGDRVSTADGTALYVSMDLRLKNHVHEAFKNNSWTDIFFTRNQAGERNGYKLGGEPQNFRNQYDKGRRDYLKAKNGNGTRDGGRAYEYGSMESDFIYFQEGKSNIVSPLLVDGSLRNNTTTMEKATSTMLNNPDYKAIIIGSANTNGNSNNYDNMGLSLSRTREVIKALTDASVSANMIISSAGIGASTLKTGSTNQGTLELNRNVEIKYEVPYN
jgi:RHS repeat-associated protein